MFNNPDNDYMNELNELNFSIHNPDKKIEGLREKFIKWCNEASWEETVTILRARQNNEEKPQAGMWEVPTDFSILPEVFNCETVPSGSGNFDSEKFYYFPIMGKVVKFD